MTTPTLTATHDLELIAIDDDAWRLCDRRQRRRDAAFVVAYIERTENGFDVIWMRGHSHRAWFATLEEACRAAELVLDGETSRRTRPVPIPHFPPRTG